MGRAVRTGVTLLVGGAARLSASSYMSQNDLRVFFGPGTASRVDRLEVRWPSGLAESWLDLPIDRTLTLEESRARPLAAAGEGRR